MIKIYKPKFIHEFKKIIAIKLFQVKKVSPDDRLGCDQNIAFI